jgi:photosystem II stability/assembly factor-like uncharacterized protein
MEGLFRVAAVPMLLAAGVAAALPWVLGARGRPARAARMRPERWLAVVALAVAASAAGCDAVAGSPERARATPVAPFLDPLDVPAARSMLAPRSAIAAVTRAGARLVAVGQRGHVLLSDDAGVTWVQAVVPVSTDLTAVHFPTPSRGWAVGHDGVVLATADGGRTWARQAVRSAPEAALLDVWFADERRGFVVGAFNVLLSTDDGGESWTRWADRIENPSALHLHAVRGAASGVVVAGERGLLLRLDPAARRFRAVSVPRGGSFFGLVARGDGVIAFGLGGRAVLSEDGGKTWHEVSTGVDVSLTGGTALPRGRIALVSQAGHVIVSDDGGRSFRPGSVAADGGHVPPAASIAAADGEMLVLAGPMGLRRQRVR